MQKRKLLNIIEIFSSVGLLVIAPIILFIHNTISYEAVSVFEKTPKSSIFVVMENNPLLGYLMILFGVTLAISALIRRWNKL